MLFCSLWGRALGCGVVFRGGYNGGAEVRDFGDGARGGYGWF